MTQNRPNGTPLQQEGNEHAENLVDGKEIAISTRKSSLAVLKAKDMSAEGHESRKVIELGSFEGVCEHFNLGALIDAKPIGNGKNNAVTCLTTDKGKYILKHYKDGNLNRSKRLGKLSTEAHFLDYLKKKGFKCGAVHKDEVFMYGEDYALIFDFVEGEPPEANDENLVKLGRQTSLIHQLSSEYNNPEPSKEEERPSNEIIRKSLEYIGMEPEKVGIYMGRLESLDLSRFPQGGTNGPLEEFLIHTDLNPNNMLLANGELNFIDFEFLRIYSPLYDITKIMEAWCSGDSISDMAKKVNLFLSEYEKIRPFQNGERELLLDYYEWKMLARLVRNSVACLQETDPTFKDKRRKFAIKSVKKFETLLHNREEMEKELASGQSR